MPRKLLARSYFNRPTLTVARGLMGKYVVRETEKGEQAGLIVVTEREGFPAAVLIRAVECDNPTPVLIDGPGRLCRSFHIDRTLNRRDLTEGKTLWLEDR